MAVIRMALFEMQPAAIKEMGKRGRDRVVREFSKEKMAERLEREFDVTLTNKGIGFTGILLFVGGIMVGVEVGLMLLF